MQQQLDHYAHKLEFEIDSWDLAEAQKAQENVVVLDARSAQAYDLAHIPGALSFPHKRMTAEHTGELRRDALYVVYCDGIGCNASTAGALKMARLGFRVKELIGGLDWWKRSGFPLAGAHTAQASIVPGCACD
ncbi:rhodanese-like domain-containing protein [Pseudomonas sp. NPDC077186]|uniref:rhodanese-like domain-containing protein n=1 Tax=Pseudomonas sp. NPDC077186 TaxID=3364421 RepID=UPI0037C5A6AE